MADRGAARGLVVALTPQAADEALAGDGTFDTALRFHVLPEADGERAGRRWLLPGRPGDDGTEVDEPG